MHTTYCDGKGSPEEMVLAALGMGLETVGLSGHSYTWFDESYCMSRENTERYIEEVRWLKAKYDGRIQVLLGTELDYWSEIDTSPYDYLIGSSHYVRKGDAFLDIDYYAELLMEEVRDNYGGDVLGLCEDYYAQMGNIVRRTGCDIIGHFDLVTKFIERYALDENGQPVEIYRIGETPFGAIPDRDEQGGRLRPLIDTQNPRYIEAWRKAVDQIFEDTKVLRSTDGGHANRLEMLGVLTAGDKPVFEINTGAMSKGNRTTPYPASDQIEYIRSKGGILIYSSDAHTTDTISYAFETLNMAAL